MTRTITFPYDIRQKVFWSLFALLTITFISYAFLLNKTIADVVYVEENKNVVLSMSSDLSELESQYLSKSATVTIENAYNLGFVDDNNTSYIKAPTLTAEVSLGSAGQ